MRLTSTFVLGAGATLACAAFANAQSTAPAIVVPPLCEHTDGGGNAARHVFSDTAFRSQHVVLGSFLTSQPNWTGAVLGVSFRPDSGTQTIGAPNGGTFTDVTVKFSYTAFEPTTLSDTFQTNRDQPQVLVYDCTAAGSDPDLVVPVHPTSNDTDVGPWFDINFSTPQGWQPPAGFPNMLIEIESQSGGGQGFAAMDAHQPGGKFRRLGTSGPVSCPSQFGGTHALDVSGSSINGRDGGNRGGMVPGDGFQVFATGAECMATPVGPVDAPCVLLLQPVLPLPTGGYVPLPQPTDLSVIGMTGQTMYLDLSRQILSIPGTFAGGFRGPQALFTLNIPNDPGNENWRLLGQVATIDPAGATHAPVAVDLTNAVEMFMGLTGGMSTHPTGQVSSTDLLSGTGNITGAFTSAQSYGAVLRILTQ